MSLSGPPPSWEIVWMPPPSPALLPRIVERLIVRKDPRWWIPPPNAASLSRDDHVHQGEEDRLVVDAAAIGPSSRPGVAALQRETGEPGLLGRLDRPLAQFEHPVDPVRIDPGLPRSLPLDPDVVDQVESAAKEGKWCLVF